MTDQQNRSLILLSGWAAAGLVSLALLANAFFSKGSSRASADLSDSADGRTQAREAKSADSPPARAIKATRTIDQAQRRFLWEVEHQGNLLAEHGFSAFAKALSQSDAASLAKLFADDFQGQAPDDQQQVRLETDFADVVRSRQTEAASLSLDRDAFVARLLEYRQLFGQVGDGYKPPKCKLSLKALSPVDREDLDGIWRGSCLLRMWGETEPGKPAEVSLHLEYQLARPTEQVLAQPGWLRSCSIVQSQLARSPRFLLREVAAERGLNPERMHDNWSKDSAVITVTGGVYSFDYNRDGILDVVVSDTSGLYFFQGLAEGKFENVALEVGLAAAVHTQQDVVAMADLDGDGWEDLILGELIFRNDAGRRFVDVTNQCSLRTPLACGGLALADYDLDGRVDIYATVPGKGKADSWIEGKSGRAESNQLWRNLGNWQFENVTEATGTAGGRRSTFSAVWLDADNDGWPDLHVINEFGSGGLLINPGQNGGERFTEHLLAKGPADFGSMGVTAGDIDNDGRIDLYVANMYSKAGSRVIGNLKPDSYPAEIMAVMHTYTTGSQLWQNQGGLRFERRGAQFQVADVGWSYGPALVDLDNDGWLDIYATCGFVSRTRDKPDG